MSWACPWWGRVDWRQFWVCSSLCHSLLVIGLVSPLFALMGIFVSLFFQRQLASESMSDKSRKTPERSCDELTFFTRAGGTSLTWSEQLDTLSYNLSSWIHLWHLGRGLRAQFPNSPASQSQEKSWQGRAARPRPPPAWPLHFCRLSNEPAPLPEKAGACLLPLGAWHGALDAVIVLGTHSLPPAP